PKGLAPVGVAPVCAALTQRGMSHMKALFDIGGSFNVSSESYFLFALLGVAAAGVSGAGGQGAPWIAGCVAPALVGVGLFPQYLGASRAGDSAGVKADRLGGFRGLRLSRWTVLVV